ncbi:MAG: hypothetical protein ABH830_02700 [Patescibacteria group bacterium]
MEKENKTIKKVLNFFEKWYVLYPILFFLSILLFSWLQSAPVFSDPDAFYHAKMAELTKEQGFVSEFPWLQLTFLKNAYTDQHFLFHLLTIPFLRFFEPLVALKIISILLSSMAIIVIAALLRYFKVKRVFWWALLLLTIAPFIMRLSLAKASPLALFLVLLGVYFIFKKKYISLFALAMVYVWSHGGFILIFFLSCLYLLLNNMYSWNQTRKLTWVGLGGPIATFFGIILGLVINPYFPRNLEFYWYQVIEIGLVNYQKYFGVGAEWYPYNFIDLVGQVNFIFVLLLIAIIIEIFRYHRPEFRNWYFLMAIILFFFFTLKSRRYVEYFVPFAFIWSILVIDSYIWTENFKKYWQRFLGYYKSHKFLTGALTAYFVFAFFYGSVSSLYFTKERLDAGADFYRFKVVGDYFRQNDISGKIIFHINWDEFPELFYHANENYYLAGLDPTFSYKYDAELFYSWNNIATGKVKKKIGKIAKEKFGAEYIFINTKREKDWLVWAYLKRDEDLELVLETPDINLYKIK